MAVMLVLMKHRDHRSGECWPGIRLLADLSGTSPNTVSASIKVLESHGLLKANRNRGHSTTYTIVETSPVAVATIATVTPGGDAEFGALVSQNLGGGDAKFGAEQEPITRTSELEPYLLSELNSATQKEGGDKKPKKTKPTPDPADKQTAEWIWAKIQQLQPRRKPPNIAEWANEVRLMRTDYTDDEIRAVFAWANSHDFWQTIILDPKKLSKKFNQLLLLKSKGPANGHHSSRPRQLGYLEYDPVQAAQPKRY